MAEASARFDVSGFLTADWPAPARVHTLTTTRRAACADSPALQGFSSGRYGYFNLATHVGDEPAHVEANRRCLSQLAALPAAPHWLNQVHSNRVVTISGALSHKVVDADASLTSTPGTVCAVLTADCLPVFFCNRAGTEVAVAHAGWRGLQAGILAQTVEAMSAAPADILVWFGPAIGPSAFEVGEEVRQAFLDKSHRYGDAFTRVDASHYLCDIYQLGRVALGALGVSQFYGGGLCTFRDAQRFYSFRRDGQTGRLASLIWLGS